MEPAGRPGFPVPWGTSVRAPKIGPTSRPSAGLTLVELVIATTLILTVMAIALPNMIASRMKANEAAAVSLLRSVSAAQTCFRETALADEDLDGVGEYGTFGEMGGRVEVRGNSTRTPDDLTASMSLVDVAGEVQKVGYAFRMYLPREDGSGQREQPYGGMRPGVVNPDYAELHWACYAWPVTGGISGARTYFLNQDGRVLQSSEPRRAGQNSAYVRAGDAFLTADPDSMIGQIAVGTTGSDGNVWTPLQ